MTTETRCDKCYKTLEEDDDRVQVTIVQGEHRSSWFAPTYLDETEWDFCSWECAKAFIEARIG